MLNIIFSVLFKGVFCLFVCLKSDLLRHVLAFSNKELFLGILHVNKKKLYLNEQNLNISLEINNCIEFFFKEFRFFFSYTFEKRIRLLTQYRNPLYWDAMH